MLKMQNVSLIRKESHNMSATFSGSNFYVTLSKSSKICFIICRTIISNSVNQEDCKGELRTKPIDLTTMHNNPDVRTRFLSPIYYIFVLRLEPFVKGGGGLPRQVVNGVYVCAGNVPLPLFELLFMEYDYHPIDCGIGDFMESAGEKLLRLHPMCVLNLYNLRIMEGKL